MGMLERAKEETALLWIGSRALPTFATLGSGSGTFNTSQSGLIADLGKPALYTNIISGTSKEITWTCDWGATTLSGIQVREFGFGVGSSGNGIWNRETCNTINFDGSNELQLQITYQTY